MLRCFINKLTIDVLALFIDPLSKLQRLLAFETTDQRINSIISSSRQLLEMMNVISQAFNQKNMKEEEEQEDEQQEAIYNC